MKMNKFKSFITAVTMIIAVITILPSCKKDKVVTPPADVTQLSLAITAATTLHSGSTEGTKPGNYAVGSKAAFKTNIDLATAVKNGGTTDAAIVTNAISNLNQATLLFQGKLIQEVSVANLMANWKFDGNANDATANVNNGTLKGGWKGASAATASLSTTLPTLVPDRFARANSAYTFSDGAYIEIPYKLALNPPAMSISLWVKRSGTNENNIMVALNRWNGFKFQLQSANKLFTTVATVTSPNGIFDRDSEGGIVADATWTHVATTYVDGTMRFYINGVVQTTTWVQPVGAIKALLTPMAFTIGQQYPASIPVTTLADTHENYYWAPSFFIGAMDDVRFYNKALTGAEVLSIFTFESTL